VRRRHFLHTVLAGGGLAGSQMFLGRTATLLAGSPQTPAPAPAGASAAASVRHEGGPIIDVHLHAYPAGDNLPPDLTNPITGKPVLVKNGAEHMHACLAEMKRLNVVKGVVSGGTGDRLGATAQWRDAAPDRIIGGAGVRGSEDTPLPELGVLRKAFSDGRLRVLGEITAEYAGLTLSDAKYAPYLALCEEFDIPAAVHTGIAPPGTSYDPCCHNFRVSLGNPALIEEALNRHPKLRVNLMHGGFPFLDDTIALMMVYPQVYADLGAMNWLLPRQGFYAYFGALMRAGLGKRIMFGTDQMFWPEAIGMAIEAVESAPFLSPEEKRDIFYNNAVRFLKLA
jgi:uncharacterized protein